MKFIHDGLEQADEIAKLKEEIFKLQGFMIEQAKLYAGVDVPDAIIENVQLRTLVGKLATTLQSLAGNANRILDVYPKDIRGTYYDDLARSVESAKRVLEEVREKP